MPDATRQGEAGEVAVADADRAVRLGATWDGAATTFAVWSGVASAIDLCIFDPDGRESRIAMTPNGGGTWQARVPGARPGTSYGYRADGPWDASSAGPLCDPLRLLLDPRARAIGGAPTWDPALFPVRPARRAGRDRPSSHAERSRRDTAPFAPRSIVIDPAFDWAGDRSPNRPLADSVIYEVHVKGFTQRHPRVPLPLRGTYAGLAHPAAIEHLADLGVTAVELLPVQHFVDEPRLAALGLRNYWGYNPIGHFAPHASYAAGSDPRVAVRELKEMIRALHAAELEVILDVVYNHTAEGGSGGPILSLKGLDNAAYYRLRADAPDPYEDLTACGNTLDARSPAVRSLVLESLRSWVEEYHVDGFRFDLAATLGRGPHGFDREHPLLAAIRDDPVLGSLKLIAEPWDAGPDGYRAGHFAPPWAEWNDAFRDTARDLWRGVLRDGAEVARRLAGSPDRYRASGRPPTASVNYVAVHDGMTLADLVAYERKRNLANGEDGDDGSPDDRSANHGAEGETLDPVVRAARLRARRNLLATLLLAQGVPLLLAGDELGRSQGGNNNAYCQDNEVSWLDWTSTDPSFLRYVQDLVALRAARPALRQASWLEPDARVAAWQNLQGDPATPDAWPAGESADLLVRIAGPSSGDAPRAAAAQHCVVIQPGAGQRRVRLPVAPGIAAWRVVLDTAAAEPFPEWGRALVPGDAELVEGPCVMLLDGIAR